MASEGDIQQSIHKALQANKDHQYALRIYSERIDAELESLNKLLAAADVSDTEEDTLEVNSGGWVVIPDATDAIAPISSADLIHHASPFRDAALRRQRYVDATVMHQWKPNDLEALDDAVKSENHRLYAVEAQLRGQQGLPRQTEDLTKFMEENTAGIDWERVSVKVSKSSLSGDFRSAKACEIKWTGERHPRFNHSQWMQPEIDRVKELVAGRGPGQVNWVDVAEQLGTRRTPLDCMRHAISRKLHVWDADSDQRLREAVEIYGTDNWIFVARLVSEDATPQQCQNRWTRYLDPRIKHEPFTEEEDKLLRDAVAVYGNAWNEIAPFLAGRTNEQCRERAMELNTIVNVKKKWTEDEDRLLLETTEDLDVIDFKEVANTLGTGRTEAQVRNRYSALMRRVNRMTASGASQTLRPILPAPSLQPIAGPSRPAPQAVLRPPGTFRPILPAPARPLEVGQIPYPGLPAQAPAPPPIASRAIAPAPGSLQMIDPALWSSGTPPPVSDATIAPQAAAGAPSSSESGDPTPLGGQPQQSRIRPRPLRKRVAEASSELADAPPPGDDLVHDAEAATPAATGKDKGKAKATAPLQGDDEHEEETHPQARKPTKRSRNVAADRPPSKKRTTKKKTTSSAGDQVTSADAANEADGTPPGHSSSSDNTAQMSSIDANISSQHPAVLSRPLSDGGATPVTTDIALPAANVPMADTEAEATTPSVSGGRRGKRQGPRSQPARQQPTRRSTRLQQSTANAPTGPSEQLDTAEAEP